MQKNALIILLLGTIFLFNAGCAALLVGGGAGAGTVSYIKGELKSTEDASMSDTWQAARKAVEELEFTIESSQIDATSAKLVARQAGDKKVTIYLQRVTENATEITIRVGMFGDESLSQLILERIKKHL